MDVPEDVLLLLKDLVSSFKQYTDTAQNTWRFEIVRHCNERYENLRQERQGFREDGRWKSMAHRLSYYEAFWSLQVEQFYYFKIGAIDPELFKFWLKGKYHDYYAGQEVGQRLMFGERAIDDPSSELHETDYAMSDFQDSWLRAKRYLTDTVFIAEMDIILSAPSEEDADGAIDIFLKKYVHP